MGWPPEGVFLLIIIFLVWIIKKNSHTTDLKPTFTIGDGIRLGIGLILAQALLLAVIAFFYAMSLPVNH